MDMRDEIIKRVEKLSPDKQRELLDLLQSWETGKQREYYRKKIKTDADIATASRVIQSDTRDISAGGIFINTTGNVNLGDSVRVVFSIPGTDKPFKLEGRIRRIEDKGIAIQFENVTSYFRSILESAVLKVEARD